MTKLSIIYYSATGHGDGTPRRRVRRGRGADVRLRHVAQTRDPESFAQNPAWTANYEATKDLPVATGDDVVWADAVIFGSPTRFGSPKSQFADTPSAYLSRNEADPAEGYEEDEIQRFGMGPWSSTAILR